MKTGLAKRLPALVIGFMLMAGYGSALADTTTKPYLKSFGADVMTGGWFDKGTSCSSSSGSAYQSPTYVTSGFAGDFSTGGILTYANKNGSNAAGGSSSQYGALSLGKIDDTAGGGFYSAGVQGGGPVNTLTFSNTDPGYAFGGFFEGSIHQGNCLPDYFDKVDPNDTVNNKSLLNNWRPAFVSNSQDGTYYGNAPAGSSLNLFGSSGAGDLTLKAGNRLAIFVNGNVYIDHNVLYDPASTVDSVPKFALVVKGNIFVDPSVHELDGFYVAQPVDNTQASVANDTGVFWSCHGPNSALPTIYDYANCSTPLVVNGAVAAKQVNLVRIKGDIASANTTTDDNPGTTISNCSSNPPSYPSCNVAESINYTPAILMGGSFFDTQTGPTNAKVRIDSILSLPPVF